MSEDNPLAMFWNTDQLRATLHEARDAFPAGHFTHTVAAKANPLLHILQTARDAGAGCEAASLGELTMAILAGGSSRMIFINKSRSEWLPQHSFLLFVR